MAMMNHVHRGGCIAGSLSVLYAIRDSVSAKEALKTRHHQQKNPQQEMIQELIPLPQYVENDMHTSLPVGAKQVSLSWIGECLDSSYLHYCGQDDGVLKHEDASDTSCTFWDDLSPLTTEELGACWDASTIMGHVDASSDDAFDSLLTSDLPLAESGDTHESRLLTECSGNSMYSTAEGAKWRWCEDDEMQAQRVPARKKVRTL